MIKVRLSFRDIVKSWLPVVVWMALMFVGSTDLLSAEHTSRFLTPFLHWLQPDISPAAIARVHLFVRKSAHVAEYAILTGLLFRAFRGMWNGFWGRAAASFLPVMIFAFADEYHQSFVASRTSSLGDVLIDCGGAVAGIVICRFVHRALERRRNDPKVRRIRGGPERI